MKTKTKLTVAILSAISLVGLAGTGYAGWVIAQNASGHGEGNVKVNEITDNGVQITDIKFEDNKNYISWGKATKTATNSWFNAGQDVDDEFFTPTLKFNVANNTASDTVQPTVNAKIVVNDDKDKNYSKCLASHYIIGPSDETVLTAKVSDSDSKTNTFACTVTLPQDRFGWGEHFKSGENILNPVNFYNEHNPEDKVGTDENAVTYFDDAKTVRGAIAKLKDVKFTITLTANHA